MREHQSSSFHRPLPVAILVSLCFTLFSNRTRTASDDREYFALLREIAPNEYSNPYDGANTRTHKTVATTAAAVRNRAVLSYINSRNVWSFLCAFIHETISYSKIQIHMNCTGSRERMDAQKRRTRIGQSEMDICDSLVCCLANLSHTRRRRARSRTLLILWIWSRSRQNIGRNAGLRVQNHSIVYNSNRLSKWMSVFITMVIFVWQYWPIAHRVVINAWGQTTKCEWKQTINRWRKKTEIKIYLHRSYWY